MRRVISLIACAALAIALLTGCQSRTKIGQAEDEILTYRKLDSAKTTLIVGEAGNVYLGAFARAFEEKNPDVQIVLIDLTSGDRLVKPVADWVKNGQAPDILFAGPGTFTAEETTKYFEDLSNRDYVENYQSAQLNSVAVDARAYWLPGPSQIECMIYNRTLFEKYGWEVPRTFDEFVALCARIREDTSGEVEPWNPNAKYSNEYIKVTEAFVYQDVFAGLTNRAWYEDFCSGLIPLGEHMAPYYEAVQTLAENGILREEHFSYSATTRGKEFAAGKIAMCNAPVSILGNDEYEYDFMPFPTTEGAEGYVINSVTTCVGVPRKEGSKARAEAVERFMAFFSSKEGQSALIGEALMVSGVKDVPTSNSEKLAALNSAIDAGHMFSMLNFDGAAYGGSFSLSGQSQAIVKGEMTAEECVAAVKTATYVPIAEEAPPEVLATATENFTILQTSNYIADMYREKAGADVGLIANNVAYRGNLMKIFKGELTSANVTTLLPRSFGNGSTLEKYAMTGEQLLAALDNPLGNGETADCVYAFSGLKCEIAPWRELGERYVSVKTADGAAIDPAKTYTVAAWAGTIDEAYISETLETYEGTFQELLAEKLKAESAIAPAKDGRAKLLWD